MLALALAGAASVILAPPAAAVERVADGGFDAAVCNVQDCTSPVWVEEATEFPYRDGILLSNSGPICSGETYRCATSGSGYVSGYHWARLGAGIFYPSQGYVSRTTAISQTVQIPAAPATLTFYLRILDEAGSYGSFHVSVGGRKVFRAVDTTPGYFPTYARVRVDLSAFAGGAREIRFEGGTQAVGTTDSDSDSFDVDDVSVDAAGPPSPPPGPGPAPGPGPGPVPGPGPGPGPGPDADGPRLSALSLSPGAFRAANSGSSITTRGGSRVGYTVSAAAAVNFGVEQARAGRRVGGSCVRPTRANRRRQRCTRYVVLSGSFTHQGSAGANTLRFSGRLRGRKLPAGRYRLRAVATDPSANTSVPRRSFFTILPRR
jgi:hypothetical protein